MQSFEVLQISIKEGVLVVPFDLHRDLRGTECPDVINFVADGLSRDAIDKFFDLEFVLLPSDGIECTPE